MKPLGPSTRVLDLACGKGAIGIALAQAFGCQVTGVDACDIFVEAAAERSAAPGLKELCTWILADIRGWSPPAGQRFDVAMMVGLDSVSDAAPVLRRAIARGGFYVMDDAVRMLRHGLAPRYAEVPTARDILAFIEGLGDEVVGHRVLDARQARRIHQLTLERLTRASRLIARERPGLKEELTQFVKRHKEASRLLEGPLRPSWWIVRKH
jgi:SAM-dependent methyltransferase